MPVNSSAVSKLDKLLRSVLRRWLNASKQTVFKSLVLFAVRCSGFLGIKRITAESTFGAGLKHSGGTSITGIA